MSKNTRKRPGENLFELTPVEDTPLEETPVAEDASEEAPPTTVPTVENDEPVFRALGVGIIDDDPEPFKKISDDATPFLKNDNPGARPQKEDAIVAAPAVPISTGAHCPNCGCHYSLELPGTMKSCINCSKTVQLRK